MEHKNWNFNMEIEYSLSTSKNFQGMKWKKIVIHAQVV